MQTICNTERYFPNNTHLLGNAAYTNQKHLLVPYKNNGRLSEREENFDTRLSMTRMTVERSIGLLKGRFRFMLDRLPVKRMDLVPSFIIACCVLHNFCLLNGDYIEIPLLARNDNENMNENIEVNVNLRNEGTIKRNAIKDILPYFTVVLFCNLYFFIIIALHIRCIYGMRKVLYMRYRYKI